MNILFLIGNGFDVNLGMHTSYADFYKYYVNKISPSKNVEALKENIARYKDTNKWSDLEKGLGLYTTEVKSVGELREAYFDINDELKDYLKGQLSTLPLADVKLSEKIKKDLALPGRYFSQRQQKEIENFISSTSNTHDSINIITFNYTDTIEKILEVGNRNISLELSKKNPNGYRRLLHTINHIHGTLDDSELIMGVNDISQILKEEFRDDNRVLDILVKPTTTLNRGDLMDDNCENLINNADLICLFGLSIGETDNKWWTSIAQHMKNSSARIIYYGYTKDKMLHSQDRWEKEREYKNILVEKFMMQDLDSDNITNRIYVLFNSKMFKKENKVE